MKYLLYFFLTILVLALNFGVLAPVGWHLAVPSTFLLLIIAISLEQGNLDFLFFAVLGGLWMDIYSGLPIGSFSGAYLFVGWAGYLLYQRLLAESSWKYYLIFVAIAEVFLLLWLGLYTNILVKLHYGIVAIPPRQLLHQTLPLLISSLLCALPVYSAVNMVVRFSRRWLRQPMRIS